MDSPIRSPSPLADDAADVWAPTPAEGGSSREARAARDVDQPATAPTRVERGGHGGGAARGGGRGDSAHAMPPREGRGGRGGGGRGGGYERDRAPQPRGPPPREAYRDDRPPMRDDRAPPPAYRDTRDSWGPPPRDARGPPLPARDSWGPPPRDDRRAPPPPAGGWGDRGDDWDARGRGPPPREPRDSWGPPPRDDRDRRDSWGPPPPRGYDDYGPPPGYYDDRGRGYADDRGPPPRAYYDDRDRGYYRDRSPPRGDYYDRRPAPRDYDYRGPPPLPRDDPRSAGAASEAPRVIDTNGNNGLVVGPKGSNVRRIEEETGARVNCLSDKTTVEISGPPEAVRRASDMITDLLANKDRTGGEDLRSRLGAGKRGRDDDRRGGDEKRFRSSGSLLENLRAAAADAGLTKTFPPEYVDESQVDDQGHVFQSTNILNYIGLIIGKNGRMQAEIQALVEIPMNINREEATVSFKGPADKVGLGLALVREVIETTNALNEVRGRDVRRDDRRDDRRGDRRGDRRDNRRERDGRRDEGGSARDLPAKGGREELVQQYNHEDYL